MRVGNALSPASAAKFSSLSDTLQEAAVALRKVVPLQASGAEGGGGGTDAPAPAAPVGGGAAAGWALPWSPAGGSEGPWISNIGDDGPLCEGDLSPSIPSVLMGNALSPGLGELPSLPIEVGGTTIPADSALAPTIQRLVCENATLREAFDDANKRLSRLEEEKLRFLDEGVFDLVNSVCGHTGGSATGGPDVWNSESAVTMSPQQLALSPNSALAARVRRSAEERRSVELSGENEELRRELARASELGEALEQQQQAAEDRMHSLEQEQAWLAERFRRVATGSMDPDEAGDPAISGIGLVRLRSDASAGSCGSAFGMLPPAAATDNAAELDVRQQLEDMNRTLRAELQDASRRQEELVSGQRSLQVANGEARERQLQLELQAEEQQQLLEGEAQERQRQLEQAKERQLQLEHEAQERQLQLEREAHERHCQFESAALERQRRLESAAEAERAQLRDRDRIISSLDVQTQDLERRLRDTEARARVLADENVRLQTALGSLPHGTAALEAVGQGGGAGEAAAEAEVLSGTSAHAAAGPGMEDGSRPPPLELDLDEAW